MLEDKTPVIFQPTGEPISPHVAEEVLARLTGQQLGGARSSEITCKLPLDFDARKRWPTTGFVVGRMIVGSIFETGVCVFFIGIPPLSVR